MILEKKLTIKELLKEMDYLKKQIYSLETVLQRRINPLKGITYEDVNSTIKGKGGHNDPMTNNLIQKDELKTKLDVKKDSYYSYREQAIEEIAEMMSTKSDEEMVVFFRDDLHWKWNDVIKVMHCSLRKGHYLYKKGKE